MHVGWYAWVIVLVVSPAEVPVEGEQPEAAWKALKQFALDAELVGPHERWAPSFHEEVGYVRRYWRLLPGAPRIDDRERFPSQAAANRMAQFSAEFRWNIESRVCGDIHRQDMVESVIEVARRREAVWGLVLRVRNPDSDWASVRGGMARLREILGEEAYYAGRLPPCVPLEAFIRLD